MNKVITLPVIEGAESIPAVIGIDLGDRTTVALPTRIVFCGDERGIKEGATVDLRDCSLNR